MALVVQKYGGIAVSDTKHLKHIARRVADTAADNDVVVVVSSMHDDGPSLTTLAREMTAAPEARDLAMLIATGAQLTVALLTMALKELRHHGTIRREIRAFTGAQAGIFTDSRYIDAEIERVDTRPLQAILEPGGIAVVAGLQAANEAGEITTLGPHGSDLTAVVLAAELHADVCEIHIDFDGLYTADPSIVSDAKKLSRITYDEMLEFSPRNPIVGPKAIAFAKTRALVVHVRSSFSSDEGTYVTPGGDPMDDRLVTAVSYDRDQAKISILGLPDRPGIAGELFTLVSANGLVVDMIVQNISHAGLSDISFTVSREAAARAVDLVTNAASKLGAVKILSDPRVVKISIVGVGMQRHSGIAATMFTVLGEHRINIEMISTSEIAVSCIVADRYGELAVRALHDTFALARP